MYDICTIYLSMYVMYLLFQGDLFVHLNLKMYINI